MGDQVIVQLAAAHMLHHQKQRMPRLNHLKQLDNLHMMVGVRGRAYMGMIQHLHDAHLAIQFRQFLVVQRRLVNDFYGHLS